jgi:hypothetical protein
VSNLKKRLLSIILCTIGATAIVHANCPSLDKVTFQCYGKHCAWSAPWWEGYQGDAKVGDHPAAFVEAFWGASADPASGSINCFYKDANGQWVELSQNNWGGIAKPQGPLWKDGIWRLMINVKVCDDSVGGCQFDYGNS